MKNLLKFVLLIALFISTSSDVFSQTITNNTGCDFSVTVFFSDPGDCDNSDNIRYFVRSGGFENYTPPAGQVVDSAKGRSVEVSTTPSPYCEFAITLCGGPTSADVVCVPCGDFTASIDAAGNITITP